MSTPRAGAAEPCARAGRLFARPVRSAVACCLCGLVCLLASGCRLLSCQGPVSKPLANCRQFSQQGRSSMERGDWRQAEVQLAKAVESCPVDADARRLYAETLWRRGDAKDAIVQLEEATRITPDDVTLTVRLGEMYLESKRVPAALTSASEALDLDPRSPEAWKLRGRALEADGKFSDALAAYQRSLSYAPACPEVHLAVAEAYRKLNQPEHALAALQALADTYPPGEEPQQVLYLVGLSQQALGRNADAADSFAQACHRGLPTAELFYRLAAAEYAAGRATQAVADAERALAITPSHAPSRALRDQILTAGRPGPTVWR